MRFLATAAWASNTYFSFVLLQRFPVPTEQLPGMIFLTTLLAIVCVGAVAWLTG